MPTMGPCPAAPVNVEEAAAVVPVAPRAEPDDDEWAVVVATMEVMCATELLALAVVAAGIMLVKFEASL
jgi:hypothetical protein